MPPIFIPCDCSGGAPVGGDFALLSHRAGTAAQLAKFDYALETQANGTSLASASNGAARSSENALFWVGTANATQKYNLATDAVIAGGNMPGNQGANAVIGTWYNSAVGFFAGYNAVTVPQFAALYQWPTDTTVSTASLSAPRDRVACAGSAQFAVTRGGINGVAVAVTTTDKNDLSSGTGATATALASARGFLNGAFSNFSVAWYAGGVPASAGGTAALASTERYTVATDANAAGTALGANVGGAANASGPNYGIIAGGWDAVPGAPTLYATILKYTYATEAVAASASVVAASNALTRVGV